MADTRFKYEYRYVTVRGLERREAGNFGVPQQQFVGPPWLAVEGSAFISMTWEEIEHVAHVMRDASKPRASAERESA